MSLSENIAVQLPYLRRFSRALTGSQAVGDKYVAQLLQSLIADASVLRNSVQIKLPLYGALCKMLSSVGTAEKSDTAVPAWETSSSVRLDSLTDISRQVFLLKSVEGFTLPEIASILELPLDVVEAQLLQANAEIASLIASRVLIIEDEPLIAMDIEEIVNSLGHTALGIARTHREATIMAEEQRPQLILSDIQLADGSSGIDAVKDILRMFNVPVIFITAYPERLLTGSKPEPAFLITKPFSPDMVKAIVAQALFFQINAGSA
jgi:CheY-like chemotaxis protein